MVSGALPVPKKRGPRKAPDFVFRDRQGLLHVVECEGGQTDLAARDKQLSSFTAKGEPTGGIVQKSMVLLPANLQGQRLACGIYIARAGTPGASDMRIVDPELVHEYDLSSADEITINDPIERSETARSLRAAGQALTAAAVAAPSGSFASARSVERLPLGTRRGARLLLDERNARARGELSDPGLPTFRIGGREVVGRELNMVLPLPLLVDGVAYRRVVIREGVTLDLVEDVMDRGLSEDPLPRLGGSKKDADGVSMSGEGGHAELHVGSFASEISLETSAAAGMPTI